MFGGVKAPAKPKETCKNYVYWNLPPCSDVEYPVTLRKVSQNGSIGEVSGRYTINGVLRHAEDQNNIMSYYLGHQGSSKLTLPEARLALKHQTFS